MPSHPVFVAPQHPIVASTGKPAGAPVFHAPPVQGQLGRPVITAAPPTSRPMVMPSGTPPVKSGSGAPVMPAGRPTGVRPGGVVPAPRGNPVLTGQGGRRAGTIDPPRSAGAGRPVSPGSGWNAAANGGGRSHIGGGGASGNVSGAPTHFTQRSGPPAGGFDHPLAADHSGHGHGGDWHGHHRDDHHDHDDHFHSSFALNIGIGFGIGTFACATPYCGFNSCFSYYDAACYYPFAYADSFCAIPFAYYDPYWHHHHWSGFYVAAYNPWAPYWWWRPSYCVYSYPSGTYVSFRYCRPSCDWVTDFRFADAPCAAVSTCSLVPSCNTGLNASTNGVYQYGWFPSDSVTSISATSGEPSIAETTLPAPATAQELIGSSDRELADTYMRLGDLPSAVRVYGQQLGAHPGDVQAERSLGLALIASGRADEGAERIQTAYRIDPTLASTRIPGDLFTGADELQRMTDDATRLAATRNSPGTWLSVAVLMQAQDQPGPARTALEKARDAGLAQPVVENMEAALPAPQN